MRVGKVDRYGKVGVDGGRWRAAGKSCHMYLLTYFTYLLQSSSSISIIIYHLSFIIHHRSISCVRRQALGVRPSSNG